MKTNEENLIEFNNKKKNDLDEIYKEIPGMIDRDVAEFLYDQASKVKDGVIVEIGSYYGRSTSCIAKGSKAGNNVKVYSVDPQSGGGTTPDPTWRESHSNGTPDEKYYLNVGANLETFNKNLKKVNVDDIVTTLIGYSEQVYKRGWDKEIGMLFIDGEHRYNYVKMDVEMWCKHVINGGIIIMDDSGHPGVERSINELIISNPRYTNFENYPVFNTIVK